MPNHISRGNHWYGTAMDRDFLQLGPVVGSICKDHALGQIGLVSSTSIKLFDRSDDLLDLGQIFGREVAIIQEGSKFNGRESFPQDFEEGGHIEVRRDDTQRASLSNAVCLGDDSTKRTSHFNVSLQIGVQEVELARQTAWKARFPE